MFKREETNNNYWSFWFGFFSSKNGRVMTINWICVLGFAENPNVYSVLGGVRFLAKLSILGGDKQAKTKNILTVSDWYLISFFAGNFAAFICLVVFDIKGQVRWPFGHLTWPQTLLIVCFFLLEGLRVRWGGPSGHLTWPQTLLIWFGLFRFVFFLVCFFFFSFLKEILFPHEEGHFCIFFLCLPLLFPRFFLTHSPFFFSLTVSLCISLSLSFFLPSLFFSRLVSLFLFHKKKTSSNYLIGHLIHQYFLFWDFLSCFVIQINCLSLVLFS